MNIKEEEKILEKKCDIVQNIIVKENILLVYNKLANKKSTEYKIDISFKNNKNNTNNTLPNEYLDFILQINLTKKEIILFSKNIKPISDGRDILPLISIKKFTTINNNFFSLDDIDILDIVNNIKKFIETYKFTNLNGIYYIGDEYDQKIIESLENLDKINCNHLDIINGKSIEIPSLCTISDEHFCLYEKEQNKYNLIFYSNIKNLLSFNKTVDMIVTLNWKKKIKTSSGEVKFCMFELKIKSNINEDMDKVMDLLIEKIKNIGFEMNINEKKKGVLPNLNPEKIEGEIRRLESQLKNRDTILVFNKLLDRYEKIIEYYSAANNNKYTEYNEKLKDLLRNEKYSKYIN